MVEKGIAELDSKEELEEAQFMKTAKFEMNLKKLRLKEFKKKEEEQRKMTMRTQKQNIQIIENFEKNELKFIGNYMISSNTAIYNGDKFQAAAQTNDLRDIGVKDPFKTLIANQWTVQRKRANTRNPLMMALKRGSIESQPSEAKTTFQARGASQIGMHQQQQQHQYLRLSS